jgi:hypothetical protein
MGRKGYIVKAAGKQNTDVWEYSSIIVEKSAIVGLQKDRKAKNNNSRK